MVDELMTVLDDELDRFLSEGVTDRELEVAIGFLVGTTLLGLEDSGGRMVRVGRSLMSRSDVLPIDEQVARLRAVTADDVQRLTQQILAGPRVLSTVGPSA